MTRRLILALAALVLIVSACGSDSDSSSAPPDDASTAVHEAVISLSPTATEMLFAIGAGEQVVAVDSQSNYPTDAPVTDLSGIQPNIEAIAGYEPDLVVMSFGDEETISGIEALGATVLIQDAPPNLDGIYAQIEELGALTGNEDGAAELVVEMQTDVEAILEDVPERAAEPAVYHELDDTFYSVTSSTFVGELYALAGLANVADPAEAESGPYPQLSEEYLLDADPYVIFLADTLCCAQSAATVEARPGWSTMTAVQNGAIHELNDDIASRWGPRVVDLLDQIVAATTAIEVAPA